MEKFLNDEGKSHLAKLEEKYGEKETLSKEEIDKLVSLGGKPEEMEWITKNPALAKHILKFAESEKGKASKKEVGEEKPAIKIPPEAAEKLGGKEAPKKEAPKKEKLPGVAEVEKIHKEGAKADKAHKEGKEAPKEQLKKLQKKQRNRLVWR